MEQANDVVRHFVQGVIKENDTPSHRLDLFLDAMSQISRAQATAMLLAHKAPSGFKSVPAFLREEIFAEQKTEGTLDGIFATISSTLKRYGWVKKDETSGGKIISLPADLEAVLGELTNQTALASSDAAPHGASGNEAGNATKGRKTVRPKKNDMLQLTDRAKQFVLEATRAGKSEANVTGFRDLSVPERLAPTAILLHSRTLQDKGRFTETPLWTLRDSLTNKSSTAFDGMMERTLAALRKAGVIRRSGKGERIHLPKELRTELESLSGELAILLGQPLESETSQTPEGANLGMPGPLQATVHLDDTVASSTESPASDTIASHDEPTSMQGAENSFTKAGMDMLKKNRQKEAENLQEAMAALNAVTELPIGYQLRVYEALGRALADEIILRNTF